MEATERQFESVLMENTNRIGGRIDDRDAYDWRNLISKTLDAIEKVNKNDIRSFLKA